jgi:hypothetical protein
VHLQGWPKTDNPSPMISNLSATPASLQNKKKSAALPRRAMGAALPRRAMGASSSAALPRRAISAVPEESYFNQISDILVLNLVVHLGVFELGCADFRRGANLFDSDDLIVKRT